MAVKKVFLVFSVIFFIISLICYVQTLRLGWALFGEVAGHSSVIIAGVVVVAIPLCATVASVIVFICTVLYDSEGAIVCALACLIISVTLAGFFEIVGGVSLLLGGYMYPRVIELATNAGMISIIAGVFSCWSTFFYFANIRNTR